MSKPQEKIHTNKEANELVSFLLHENQDAVFNCLNALSRLSIEYIKIVENNNSADWQALNSLRSFLNGCNLSGDPQNSVNVNELFESFCKEDPCLLTNILNTLNQMIFVYMSKKDLEYDFIDWECIDLIRHIVEECHQYQTVSK